MFGARTFRLLQEAQFAKRHYGKTRGAIPIWRSGLLDTYTAFPDLQEAEKIL